MYLTVSFIQERFLKNFTQNHYYFNVLQTHKLRQYFIDATQATALALAMQDNAAQQWWYSKILAANTVSNTGKFAKMVHTESFGVDGGRRSHHSDLEIAENRLWWRYWQSE